jgi:hypothetical protein
LVKTSQEACQVAQAMLDLSIFHCVTSSQTFDPKNLYAFNVDNLGTLSLLKRRIVALEDHSIAQTKANKEAQADAVTRAVQLDWRVSVAERRLALTEISLRRSLVNQQVWITDDESFCNAIIASFNDVNSDIIRISYFFSHEILWKMQFII